MYDTNHARIVVNCYARYNAAINIIRMEYPISLESIIPRSMYPKIPSSTITGIICTDSDM